jgi:vacuolar-type H+-ATPase subunit E/Vma4
MGLKEIEEGIRKSVEKEIESVRAEARKEIEKIREENRKIAERKYKEIIEKGRKSCLIIRKRVTGNAKLEAREMVEKRRNDIIEELFRKARERVVNADRKTQEAMLKKFVKDGVKGIENPEIIIDKKYVHLLKGAKPGRVDDFGVIITDEKNGVEVDCTLKNVLFRMMGKMEHEIVRILWPK